MILNPNSKCSKINYKLETLLRDMAGIDSLMLDFLVLNLVMLRASSRGISSSLLPLIAEENKLEAHI